MFLNNTITFAAVTAFFIFWFISTYNKFIHINNQTKEAWSGIDVQLKRRFNLIPQLVDTVKGFMVHEKDLLNNVTELRGNLGSNDLSTQERIIAESRLSQNITKLLAVSESYPELKSRPLFADLQKNLSSIEDDIQKSRRFYNANVRDLNSYAESFPSILVAKLFNFKTKCFFEIEDNERSVHKISFQ